ncbi:hypothetical protein [Sedimenticola hydrogenitrophicus]|uniref:hypothetical protein n=1 Tax=Sedimenticola hydrogenitrophicus TaxID=2967975 RepID=UPI0023B0A183|nr:hypothetical protein [Sedimenticola hydrogenitrophicus]
MKININNETRISEALRAAQGMARARIATSSCVVEIAKELESRLDSLGIPKCHRKGAHGSGWAHIPRYEAPVTNKWGYATTRIHIARGAKDWFLVNVERQKLYRGTSLDEKLIIFQKQLTHAIRTLLRIHKCIVTDE